MSSDKSLVIRPLEAADAARISAFLLRVRLGRIRNRRNVVGSRERCLFGHFLADKSCRRVYAARLGRRLRSSVFRSYDW